MLVAVADACRVSAGFDVFMPGLPDRGPGRRVALVRRSDTGWHVDWYPEVTDPPGLAGVTYGSDKAAIEALVSAMVDAAEGR